MKRFKRFRLTVYGLLLGIAVCVLTAAGVNGVFTGWVNSTLGYQVNEGAGSSGQALCSDGTYFDTPCTTGGGTITGVTAASPLTGGGSSGAITIGLGTAGPGAGSYSWPSSFTIDAYGRITALGSSITPITSITATAPLTGSGTGPSVTLGVTQIGTGSSLVASAAGLTATHCLQWASTGVADSGSPCIQGQLLPNQTVCTPATSTDADCTGTITLSPGWSDAGYSISVTPLSTAGAHMVMVPMAKSNGSFTYNLSCAYNCSSYGSLTADVSTWHP